MTDVAFHFNAPDRVTYVCRLLRKAVNSGAKVVVIGPQNLLDELDEALWVFSPVDFVPHCDAGSAAFMVNATPIILATSADTVAPRPVLVNLGDQVPQGFERFDRVIEVVGMDDAGRQSARSRWKQYTEWGYAIIRHDLKLKELA